MTSPALATFVLAPARSDSYALLHVLISATGRFDSVETVLLLPSIGPIFQFPAAIGPPVLPKGPNFPSKTVQPQLRNTRRSMTNMSKVADPLHRLGKGVSMSLVGQGVGIASRLLEVPVAITCWGVQLYGVWLILTVVPVLLTSSDFGVGTATDRIMAREVSEQRHDDALVTYHTSMALSIALSLVCSLVVVALFAFGVPQPGMGLEDVSVTMAVVVVSLLSLKTVIQLMGRIFQAGLLSVGHYPRGILLASLGDLTGLIALVASMLLSRDLEIAALWQLLSAIPIVGLMALDLHRKVPWLTFGFDKFSREKVREMAAPALASFSLGIARSVNYTVPRILVATFGGPAMATLFHSHRQLARFITFLLMFGRPFQAEMALTYWGDNGGAFSQLALRTVQAFIWISMFSAVGVAAISVIAFPYWTRGVFALDPILFSLLILTTLAEAFGSSALLPIAALNRHVAFARTFLIANFIGFAIAVPATALFGVSGMGLALLAIDIITTRRAFTILADILKMPLMNLLASVAAPPSWGVTWALLRLRRGKV